MAKSLCLRGYEVEINLIPTGTKLRQFYFFKFSSKVFTKYWFYIYINENVGEKMKSSSTQLKEIIQSQYPENTFTDFELEEATKIWLSFFTIGAKMAYNCEKSDKNWK